MYADSRPAVPNENEQGIKIPENMAKNRRVIITIIRPIPEGFKMGFGLIYEKDIKKEIKKDIE